LKKEIEIPDFCIGLDLIGKKLVDYCLMANWYRRCKFQVANPAVDMVPALDNETVLTRLMLRTFIEYLTEWAPRRPQTILANSEGNKELQREGLIRTFTSAVVSGKGKQ